MGRTQSETTTLAVAVAFAVALGVACGVWVNTKLTAAASETSASKTAHAPSQSTTAATAEQTTPAPSDEAQAVSDDSQHQAVSDDSHPAASENGGKTSHDDSNVTSRPQAQSPASAPDAGRRPAPAAVASAAREANPSEKTNTARDGAREINAEPRARVRAGGAAPCTPYASAGSLTLRGGGSAALVLGGPGEAGRVAVTTPDWADIAVFAEGRAGGNGWVRYSVRSVSGKPGRYTLHFRTPCGSQSIPVTVTRP